MFEKDSFNMKKIMDQDFLRSSLESRMKLPVPKTLVMNEDDEAFLGSSMRSDLDIVHNQLSS